MSGSRTHVFCSQGTGTHVEFFFVGPFTTSEYIMIELEKFLRDDPGFLGFREPGPTWWFPGPGNTWLLTCFYVRELLVRFNRYFKTKTVNSLFAYLPVKK